ncbi:MAG: prolipoprotein diacylglyceryl transferase [Pseudomonadota bacterium]
MIAYPDINPVALDLGFVKIHWYGIMYLVGFVAALLLMRRRAQAPGAVFTTTDAEDITFFGAVGVVVGGRLGYILFYSFERLVENPLFLFKIWEGGMSFHGGLLGVIVAMIYFAHRRGRRVFEVLDFLAPAAPIGLMAGRIGNFINNELWGKPTDVPWAFVVNGVGVHPSQLYEAAVEGLLLFIVLWVYTLRPRPVMTVSGLFLLIYGCGRFLIEFVRVPDAHLDYLALGWVTMGQILSTPMILAGLALLLLGFRRNELPAPPAAQPATAGSR